ncbi:amidohydrolase [Streptomyces tibetensis]|uniref:amidohydrolase n=1 Tax=Streptomyces tibetensis TaxID=2382123 RepID=UPI0033FD6640
MLCTRLTNARFLTMDPDHSVAHDLGIWQGRIVGLDEAATSLPAREVVDLRGATVTACAEAGIGGALFGHGPVELGAYQLARDKDLLPLRVQLMVAADLLRPVSAHETDGIPRALDLGLRTGFGDDRLCLGALKVWTDGGMMARTAALTSPYEGLDHAGQLQDDPEVLTNLIVHGHLAGWQLAVHAIGDRAADVALDALERARRLRPRPQARHRIEHAGLIRPDQLPRFARLGVSAVVQPNFLRSFGDDYASIMGETRAPWLYRGKAFLDHGVPLVGSSEGPVADGSPLRAVQFMVERASASGRRIGPDEAVTVDQALHAYTVAQALHAYTVARACHWGDRLGSLTPGKHADLVVLAHDPRRVDTSRIGDIEVVEPYVAGRPARHRSSRGRHRRPDQQRGCLRDAPSRRPDHARPTRAARRPTSTGTAARRQ